jgi:transposase
MLTTEFSETKKAWIDLSQQANYWKTRHAKAIEREAVWRAKVQELEETLRQQLRNHNAQIKELVRQNHDQDKRIKKLEKRVEELNAQNAWLKQRLFGRQTEQTKDLQKDDTDKNNPASSEDLDKNDSGKQRSRGQQNDTPGHGRKRRTNLPSVDIFHDLKDHEKQCPTCNLPFTLIPITQDSEDIHYELRLIRRRHKRKCYVRTCPCKNVPKIITAPPPVKLIPKGMFSTDFWVHILAEKFLFQRPMSRILQTLTMEDFYVSQGTITGGLEKIKDMVYPLYTKILERSRNAKHWHMDETRWTVFVVVDGKTGYRWWFWVVVTKDTVAYILDPTRSASVPKDHLGENPEGIINADRYSVYKSLISEELLVAFCWGHVRRDFVRIYDTRKKLCSWAQEWINRINELFHLNKERLKVLSDKDKLQTADQILRNALDSFRETHVNELKSETLQPIQRKTLESLYNHWSGLLIFVDYPEIPMDNNISERALRELALGRKNYYGCGSLWSGDLTSALFTIFQTAKLNHLHPKKSLKAYLEACAQNRGNPPDNIDDFLPWNLSEKRKSAWQYPKAPP